MKDYYKILNVHHTASQEEIKKSYKDLAKKYHPDLNAGNKIFEEKFKEINEAYEILSNPNERHHYDDLYKYVILGEGRTYSEQQTKTTYSAPTREHEYNSSTLVRVFIFITLGLLGSLRNCNNDKDYKFKSGDMRIVYEDSNGNIVNGTIEQHERDKENNNAFDVHYSTIAEVDSALNKTTVSFTNDSVLKVKN